jgi:hypothetical protein
MPQSAMVTAERASRRVGDGQLDFLSRPFRGADCGTKTISLEPEPYHSRGSGLPAQLVMVLMLPRSISSAWGRKPMVAVGKHLEDPETGERLIITAIENEAVLCERESRQKKPRQPADRPQDKPRKTAQVSL